jgi:hypothetical protein
MRVAGWVVASLLRIDDPTLPRDGTDLMTLSSLRLVDPMIHKSN